MKILVVYYSRTGRTRKIANQIKKRVNSKIDEIIDTKNRNGVLGWLSAGRDAGSKNRTEIKGLNHNPKDFDVVVIGSPTWNGTVSAPIRTYININRNDLRSVAFYSTGDADEDDALNEIKKLLGDKVFTGMHFIRMKEIDNEGYLDKLEKFVYHINSFTK
jgi:flavodoxin